MVLDLVRWCWLCRLTIEAMGHHFCRLPRISRFVYSHIGAWRYSMRCLLHGRDKLCVIMAPFVFILYTA